MTSMNRRSFLKSAGALAVPLAAAQAQGAKFRISLAEWSIHKAIRAHSLSNLDFPEIAHRNGIVGLEFVTTLEAPLQDYLERLKQNIARYNCKAVLIMCDGEGAMGHSDPPRAGRRPRTTTSGRITRPNWAAIPSAATCIPTSSHDARGDRRLHRLLRRQLHPAVRVRQVARAERHHREPRRRFLRPRRGGAPDEMVNLPNFGTLPIRQLPQDHRPLRGGPQADALRQGGQLQVLRFRLDRPRHRHRHGQDDEDRPGLGYHNWVGIEYEGERQTEFDGIAAGKRYLDKLLAA